MNLRKDHSHKEMFYSTRHAPHSAFCFVIRKFFRLVDVAISLQCMRCYLSLATTNALARGSLKDAANCAKHLELQISEKEKDSERILRVDLVSTHVIGGDRNMQSLELRSLSGVHVLSQIVAPTCSWNSARLSFSSSIMISYHDVRIQGRVPLFGFQTFFLRTLTTSHGITR